MIILDELQIIDGIRTSSLLTFIYYKVLLSGLHYTFTHTKITSVSVCDYVKQLTQVLPSLTI